MRYLFFFATIAWCLSCKTKSVMPYECNNVGTVKDFTGLDGCGMLIELKNGALLNPVKRNEHISLEDGEVITFSYKELPDMMSNCMREKMSVEITCLKKMDKTPTGIGVCVDTDNPFEIGWMDHAIDLHNPNQVLKYKDGNEWAYLFRSIPNSYLYDCKGKMICVTKNDHDKCHTDHIDHLGQGKIIWQGEGVWD